MTQSSPSKPKLLQSWDSAKQAAWRTQHRQGLLLLHMLLDVSPSMYEHRAALMRAFNRYLAWMQQTAHPMSLGEIVTFDDQVRRLTCMQGLGQLQPLTSSTYDPSRSDGTALYNAVGAVCTTATQGGQHVLIVLTDGEDCARQPCWSAAQCHTLITTLQDTDNWLCVFLGAFPQAMAVGMALGFHEGNCLVFASDQIPAAFTRLQQATQRYLAAAPQERKLLTQQGVF